MKRILALTLFLAAGTAAGAAHPAAEDPAPQRMRRLSGPVRATAPLAAQDGAETPGPAEANLDVAFEATQVSGSSAGERVHLALDIDSRFTRDARVRYAFQLETDTGAQVFAPRHSEIFTMAKAGSRSIELDTPVLADGFYVARVTVVGSDGSAQASTMRQLYLESRGGTVDLLSTTDFYARSRSKVAHR